jgi:elongation factor Ts
MSGEASEDHAWLRPAVLRAKGGLPACHFRMFHTDAPATRAFLVSSEREQMAEISAQSVKQLRERTGAGMMECKKALVEANGDSGEAETLLRKWGIASASKKATRSTKQGAIGSYIHAGSQLGVLVEVNCESDFVARTDDFQDLVRDVAMHVAAADPQYVRREDVPAAVLDKEKDIQKARVIAEGKPEKMAEKIVEGRLAKFYEEVCLYEQPFVKENTMTVEQLIKAKIAKLGENISVARFARFKVGEAQTTDAGPAPATA